MTSTHPRIIYKRCDVTDDAQLMAQMDIYNEINLVVKMCIKDETEIEASLPIIEKLLEQAKAIAEERARKRAEAAAEGRGRESIGQERRQSAAAETGVADRSVARGLGARFQSPRTSPLWHCAYSGR